MTQDQTRIPNLVPPLLSHTPAHQYANETQLCPLAG